MRYLVLSDIHSNLEALNAVLAAMPPSTYDRLLVLGDLVGYGADPNPVIDRVRALQPHMMIRGNHDKAAAGVDTAEGFNTMARAAVLWTFDTLTRENREYLAGMAAGPQIVDDLIEICHGSPLDEDAYVFENLDALQSLRATQRPLCFFGHTHQAIVFVLAGDRFDLVVPEADVSAVLTLGPESRYLVNPGSVGQPRDNDPRAAFAVFDSETRQLELQRVRYDIEGAQDKIRAAGLPEALALRLSFGR